LEEGELNMATHFMGGLAMRPVAVADGTTYTFLAKNSGKVHLIPNLTADCTFTLPVAEDGLAYELWYTGTAADAQDWIINTAATAEIYYGGLVHLDTNAGAGGIEVVVVDADQSNDDTLTVLTPEAGTRVALVSDGTYWYVTGFVASVTVPTFA